MNTLPVVTGEDGVEDLVKVVSCSLWKDRIFQIQKDMEKPEREEGSGLRDKAAALLERLHDARGLMAPLYFLEGMQELTQAPEEERDHPEVKGVISEFLRHARDMPHDRFLALLQTMRQALQWGPPESKAAQDARRTVEFVIENAWCHHGLALPTPEVSHVLQLCRDFSLEVRKPLLDEDVQLPWAHGVEGEEEEEEVVVPEGSGPPDPPSSTSPLGEGQQQQQRR